METFLFIESFYTFIQDYHLKYKIMMRILNTNRSNRSTRFRKLFLITHLHTASYRRGMGWVLCIMTGCNKN